MENAMNTQKVIHTTIAILAAAASLTFSSGAQARPTLCEERAMEWCHGQVGTDGNYLHYGAPGWEECLQDATSMLSECVAPPDGGGRICIINGIFTEC
jgi:hypothetical protein